MDRRPLLRPTAALFLLALAACDKIPERRKLVSADVVDKELVGYVNRMREAFNRGECQRIYDEASDVFRELEPQQDWLSECEQMRANFGLWKTFHARTANTQPSFHAQVDGTAIFAKGEYRLQTTWNLENRRARLFRLTLHGSGKQIVIPVPRFPTPKRLIDPPRGRSSIVAHMNFWHGQWPPPVGSWTW